MTLMRMPMFTWMSFVVQFLIILAFPVITIALVFLQFDRFFGTNFYTTAAGGDACMMPEMPPIVNSATSPIANFIAVVKRS